MTTPIDNPEETPTAASFNADQLQAIVEAALAKERAANQAQINALQTTVNTLSAAVSGNTPTFITEHGAGVGSKVHETWSQFEQAAMNAAREIPAVARLAEELIAVV